MTTQNQPARTCPEVVGTFSDRGPFERAVDALVRAGFSRSDLSVLASHRSLDSADIKAERSLVALVGELKYEGPLVAAGLIALAAGPVGAAIAGLVAAGVGAAAVKELLDEVSALPDPVEFSRALEAGSIILWVAAQTPALQDRAMGILTGGGANNVHVFDPKQR